MLLTRKACYGLIVVKHLAAEGARESTLSASDLAGLYGFSRRSIRSCSSSPGLACWFRIT
jgi:hypothetical protein